MPSLYGQSGGSLTFIYGYPVQLGKRYTVKGKTVNGRDPGWFSPSSAIFFVPLFAVYSTEIEKLSMTFTPNGKRRSEIRVLPKMEEPCLILAHFCPVSSIYQATSQRNETSQNEIIFTLLLEAGACRFPFAVGRKRHA